MAEFFQAKNAQALESPFDPRFFSFPLNQNEQVDIALASLSLLGNGTEKNNYLDVRERRSPKDVLLERLERCRHTGDGLQERRRERRISVALSVRFP